jgi:uncharacterized protein YceH (UPF0502 family)
MSLPTLSPLSLLQTRVLGVLVEKQHTVPDTYPLTLNALTAGCNQKTSRDPTMDATAGEVQATIDSLRSLSLIVETSGGRVMRYAHNVERVLQIPSQAVAILATLMLRGPQTVAELRMNTERLHRFADSSALEAFLAELSERASGALVVELPRQPGSRENRWAHLLSGPPAMPEIRRPDPDAIAQPQRETALTQRVEQLEATVADLRQALDDVRAALASVASRGEA